MCRLLEVSFERKRSLAKDRLSRGVVLLDRLLEHEGVFA